MTAYVGVDWSATEIVAAMAGPNGPVRPIRVGAKPNLASVRDLLGRVRRSIGAEEVYVMIEAGAPLWVRLLHAAGAVVFVADPKQARRYAESQTSSGAKDDPRDAASLTEMCRSPSHREKREWTPDRSDIERLDLLAGMHEQLTTDLGRVKQRLRDILRKHMPLVEQALPRELRTAWVSVLLRQVGTPWHAGSLMRAEFDLLTAGARKKTRDRLWVAFEQTEAPWLDAEVADILAHQVRCDLDQMALLGKQVDQVEAQLDAVTGGMESRELVESMGGIALKLSAALIQFGFRDGIPADRDEASIRMGASPVFSGSARRKDGTPKGRVFMRRAAPSRARRATYLIGRLASQRLDWARAMYGDAMKRGQNSATAYRRITRCVLRIQTAMARTGKPYDDERYVASLQAKGVSWAVGLRPQPVANAAK